MITKQIFFFYIFLFLCLSCKNNNGIKVEETKECFSSSKLDIAVNNAEGCGNFILSGQVDNQLVNIIVAKDKMELKLNHCYVFSIDLLDTSLCKIFTIDTNSQDFYINDICSDIKIETDYIVLKNYAKSGKLLIYMDSIDTNGEYDVTVKLENIIFYNDLGSQNKNIIFNKIKVGLKAG